MEREATQARAHTSIREAVKEKVRGLLASAGPEQMVALAGLMNWGHVAAHSVEAAIERPAEVAHPPADVPPQAVA